MATSRSITRDKENKDDSFDEKNSPRSSNTSIDELTKISLRAHFNDFADSGLHRSSLDRVQWLTQNEENADKQNGIKPVPKEDEKFIERQRNFWIPPCCRSCFNLMQKLYKPCLRSEYNSIPVTLMEKLQYALLCPPSGFVANVLFRIFLLLCLWGVVWAIAGTAAEPGGNLFALFVLWIAAAILGKLLELCKLPSLLGMLIAGFMLRNIPHIQIVGDIESKWSSNIRGIALVVILIRAGLGLDPGALRKLSCVCLRLAFLPCLSEAVTVMIISHFILNLPWLWGLILGFVLAAVSPAVVVPCLLSLSDRKYGTAKGIPTLVIASASIDDVLAIGGFGVVLAIAFSTGNLTMAILQGPIELLIGIVYGTVIGLLLWFLPNKNNTRIVALRSTIIFLTSVFAVLGSRVFDFAGSGPLACLILAFIAAIKWRKEDENNFESIKSVYAFLWFIFQPFLFALIGGEISINSLESNIIGYGMATLICGLFIRICVSYVSVLGAGLTWKERVFIALAWLPKATVQAAIGPIALDYARTKSQESNSNEIEFGIQILTIAVLAIMITAPIGAILIMLTGPRLLTQDDPLPEKRNRNEVQSVNTHL